MNILYISSVEFLPYAVVSIVSLFENNKEAKALTVYLYCESMSTEDERKIYALQEKYHRVIKRITDPTVLANFRRFIQDNSFPSFQGCNYTYAKIMPHLLVPDVEKLLVVDSDTLVLQNLTPLYNLDVSDYFCAAIPELMARYVSSEDPLILHRKEFYYNSGVLLFNIAKMKKESYTQRIVNAYKNYKGKLRLADQSLLNLSLNGVEILPVNVKYNYNNGWNVSAPFRRVMHRDYRQLGLFDERQGERKYKNMAILHFIGMLKPWTCSCFCPNTFLYLKYQKKTSWGKKISLLKDLRQGYWKWRDYKKFFDNKFKQI